MIRTIILLLIVIFQIRDTASAQQTEILEQLSLDEIIKVYKQLDQDSDYPALLSYAERALELLEKEGQQNSQLYADWFYNKAYALEKGGKLKECIDAYAKTIALEQDLHGMKSEKEGIILGRIGKSQKELGDHTAAENNLKTAISILENLEDLDKSYLTSIYFVLASVYYDLAKIKLAEKYYNKAGETIKQSKNISEHVYSNYLSSIAKFYKTVGKYLEADNYYAENTKLKLKQFGKDHPKYARAIANQAIFYQQIGRLQEAEILLLQAKEIIRKKLGKEHPHYAIALGSAALLYIKMGQMSKAEQNLLETLKIYEKQYGKEHRRYLWCLNNLANLYLESNQMVKAKNLYHKVEQLSLTLFSENHPFYAQVLNNIAIYYRTIDDYTTAERYYNKALKITEESFGKEHIDYALSLNNLAQLYSKRRDYKYAKDLLLQAKSIIDNNYSPNHPESILALSNLADVYVSLHQIDSAESYALEAIRLNVRIDKISSKIDNKWQASLCSQQPISYIHLLEALQILYKVERDRYQHNHKSIHLQRAQLIAQTALQLADQYRHRFTTDSDKLHLLERSVKWTYKAIQSTIEIAEKEKIEDFEARAFAFAEQNKSVLLSEAVQNDKAHIFGDLPDSLAQKERLLQEEYSSLQAELLDSRSEEDKLAIRSKINDLNLEIEQFKKYLEKNYPKYNALKYAKNQVSTEHIQELLDEETALIEYVVADSIVYIFCVDKTHFELYQQPVSKAEIGKRVKQLRQALSNYRLIRDQPERAFQLYREQAYWFYKNLLAPAIQHDNIKHLLIIPDGELGHLPFEAFLTQEVDAKNNDYQKLPYLLYDFTISYDYSASLWDENEKSYEKVEHQPHKGLVLACAASYNKKDSSSARSEKLNNNLRQLREVLADLPAAKAEVEGLSEKFHGSFLYGQQTNEAFFKAHAHEYGVIHLAMHGLLDKAHPILSSLAFTDNGDSTEDNFLRAYEIAHLNLNAELVVLSACETGHGKFEEGEGVISLARSFMYAGVPSLVVSMWEVNDQSTAQIMMLFYENLARRMNKAAALQKAKIDYLKVAEGIAAHPAFWAAFIQLGDHHPVHLKRKGAGMDWWWFAIGFAALAAIGTLVLKFRKSSV